MNKKFLSDKTLATRYDASRSTIWRWAKIGKLPQPIKLTNGSTRWKLADIEAWEAQQEAAQ